MGRIRVSGTFEQRDCQAVANEPAGPRRGHQVDKPAPLYRLPVSTIVEFRGSFRLVENDIDRLRHLSRGTWYCRCGEIAVAAHDAPKCETCSTGGDCGLDCTVSRLSCQKCGATA